MTAQRAVPLWQVLLLRCRLKVLLWRLKAKRALWAYTRAG